MDKTFYFRCYPLSTAHEKTNLNKGEPHNETVMDLENNADGRAVGSGPATSRTALQNAVVNISNSGALTILDNLYNGNEVGLLIPSNQ